MSTIPISVTEEQFDEHIRPWLSTAKLGYVCKIALVKVFNYILYHLHTGCEWKQLPIAPDVHDPEKKS
ncbi:transposase [Aggregatilinea lenta]|uniref:transposase n=1 Tax=Aggregatilinea lenta TaxID=913108 RepID=UPI000E5B145B|nr:transposase [Aggregatilinea lenta]